MKINKLVGTILVCLFSFSVLAAATNQSKSPQPVNQKAGPQKPQEDQQEDQQQEEK